MSNDAVLHHRKGMVAWIAKGLDKVVPQPDVKGKDSAEQPAAVLTLHTQHSVQSLSWFCLHKIS